MANPSVEELKALAAALPPSERVAVGEVADVVSAVVAVIHHGGDIVKAAEQGAQGVVDFLHGRATEQAQAAGTEPPQKGAPVASPGPAAPPAPASGVDLNKLADLVVEKMRSDATAPADTTRPADVPPPTAATEAALEGQGAVTDTGEDIV